VTHVYAEPGSATITGTATDASGEHAVGGLIAIVEATDSPLLLKRRAIEALGTIGPPAKKALPVLLGLRNDRLHGGVAVIAIGRIKAQP